MRALIQRVSSASVHVEGELISQIGSGLLTLLGIHSKDTVAEVEWMMKKIAGLRIFEDENGKLNRSVNDVGGSHLLVSQFTLYADTQGGNRPSFTEAARPEIAEPLYQQALDSSRALGIPTLGGRFRATMQIALVNSGPVTIWLETPRVRASTEK